MTLMVAIIGLIISVGLAIMKLAEYFNENKKIEVSLSSEYDSQWLDIDNPSKKQFIISYWEIFWKTKRDKKILTNNFPPDYARRFILKPYCGHQLEFEEEFLLDLRKPSESAELFIELKIAGKSKRIYKKIF